MNLTRGIDRSCRGLIAARISSFADPRKGAVGIWGKVASADPDLFKKYFQCHHVVASSSAERTSVIAGALQRGIRARYEVHATDHQEPTTTSRCLKGFSLSCGKIQLLVRSKW